MKPQTISYSKTIQEKQCEPATLKIDAIIEDNDNPDACIQQLIQTVRHNLGLTVEPVTKVEKKEVKKPQELKIVEEVKEVVEEPKKEKKAPAKKKSPAAATKKVEEKAAVITKYDRVLPPHREVLGEIIEDLAPGWRKDPSMDEFRKAVAALSMSLVGHDLYEKEGEVLSSFVNEVVDTLTPLLSTDDGL